MTSMEVKMKYRKNSSNYESGKCLSHWHAKFKRALSNIKHYIGQTIMAMQQKMKSTEKWPKVAIKTLRIYNDQYHDRCHGHQRCHRHRYFPLTFCHQFRGVHGNP